MSPDSAPDRYRRRRYWPALVMIGVLLIAAAVVWFPSLRPNPANSSACNVPGPAPATTALTTRSVAVDPTAVTDPSAAAASPEAAAATTTATTAATTAQINTSLGAYADHESLAAVRPADPSTVMLRVYNSSTVRGQAKAVTDELRAAGFESIMDGANDPLYPAADLRCVAQIRFGPAGAAAARTALLVAPCAQLVVDSRIDDSIDLALGGRYIYDSVSQDVLDQLKAIRDAATPPAVIEGQTAAAKPLAPIPPLPQANCAS
ncbi:MAG: LytR C-terminal domain-containing protein [Nakamurella sp.]